MSKRGPYAKSQARREEIIDTALRVIGRDGYDGATVRELARATGMSTTGLLHHFGSKEALFTEILRRRDELDSRDGAGHSLLADRESSLREGLAGAARRNAGVPGLVQLYSHLSADAADPGHHAHAYFRDRFATVRAAYADAIRTAQAEHRLAPDLDPDMLAVVLIAVVDGLQTQWAFDRDLDMGAHIEAVFDALRTRARPEA